jgi:hypothetical protein
MNHQSVQSSDCLFFNGRIWVMGNYKSQDGISWDEMSFPKFQIFLFRILEIISKVVKKVSFSN